MTNNLVLPLLALLLVVLAALFPFRREDQNPPVLRQRIREIMAGTILGVIVVLLFAIATTLWPKVFADGVTTAVGLGIGVVAAAIAAVADPSRSGFAFGMPVLGAAILHFLPAAGSDSADVAFVAGAFIGAFATSGFRPKLTGGSIAAFGSLMIVAVDFLGHRAAATSASAASAGVALGVAFLVAALISGLISRSSTSALLRQVFGMIILCVVGYLCCWKYLGISALGNLWIGGVAIGLIVHLILAGDDQKQAFRFVLCAVIWLGAATVAFGMNLGYGMAVTLLGGASALILLGNVQGLMTMAVPATILVYRLFREMYPQEAKAPDIGQHYTMIGIAVGALLPLMPLEWAADRSIRGWRAAVASAIWLAILIGLPVAIAVLLGSKGAIGMVIGLGFAAVVEGLRGSISLAPVALATGIGALTALSYGWLGDWTDLERGIKVKALLAVGVTVLILSGALFAISRQREVSGAGEEL